MIDHVQDSLRKQGRDSRIVVFTGAAVSLESGVPHFRAVRKGVWGAFDPHALASKHGVRKHPKIVFDWYAARRDIVLKASVNSTHEILARWERDFPHFTLITQNIDGLHQLAGNERVLELHGNIHRLKCLDHGHPSAWVDAGAEVPRCAQCGSYLRTDVAFAEEKLEESILRSVQQAMESCDIFLVIGTHSQAYPAAGLLELAKAKGALTLVIHEKAHFLSAEHPSVQGSTPKVLQQLEMVFTEGS